VRKIAIAESSD